jgi:hypothetical protein
MLKMLLRPTPLKLESEKLTTCVPEAFIVCFTVAECEALSTSVRLTEYGIDARSAVIVS